MLFRSLITRVLITAAAVTVPLLTAGMPAGAAVDGGPICCVSPGAQLHAAHLTHLHAEHLAHLHHAAVLAQRHRSGV